MGSRHQYSTEFDMLKLILRTEHAAFISSMSDTRRVLTYANSRLLLPFLATLFVLESVFAAMLTRADTCLAAKLLGSAYQVSLALPGWCPLWSPSLFVSCKVKSCRISYS
jgi:hypothetical protein